MNAQEFAQCRASAELYRRARRKIEKLQEQLGEKTEEMRAFEREDEDVFALVRFNRARLKGREHNS